MGIMYCVIILMCLVNNHPNLKKHQKQHMTTSTIMDNNGMICMAIHLATSCTNAIKQKLTKH